MIYNGYPCHPWRSAVVTLPLLQQPPRLHPEFSSQVALAKIRRNWTRWNFCKNHRRRHCLLESAQSLEKPALATEGPTADTTIHEHTQSEEWIQDLKRQKDGYQNQVLSAILAIRFGVDNPPATPATRQLAIPPEERIKRLRKILDKFLASVNREVNLVRQLARQVRLSGVVAVGKAPDASSVSSLSSQSEETLGRPDLAPDAQGTKKTAKQAQLPYVAPNQRIVPCLSTRKWQWRNPVRVPINDQCRPMLHYSRKSIKTVSKRRCRGATTRRGGNVDVWEMEGCKSSVGVWS